MTEKRFAGEFDNQYSGVYDDGEQLSNFEVVKLLNELAEENKGFKIDGEFKNKAYSKLLDSFMELKKKYQGIKKENKELKKENNELKQQFILLLKKLGKKNVQCSFCEHGEHYSELVDGYYEPRFICHKKGQEYTQRSFCEDWKIKVKE